jgi:biotin transport system substrate-specific component
MTNSRAPYVTYDSTLLEHVSGGAASVAARNSIRLASVLFLTALTAAAAQFSIPLPFTPVPLTLQPTVVLLGAAMLGPRLGAASQALYLVLGVAGLPMFAASPLLPPGPARLIGPTAGYLLAYPFAAAVTGYLARRGFDRQYLTAAIAMVAGLVVIYTGGVLWLAYFMPGAQGLTAALAMGAYPFAIADVIKACAASALLPVAWKLLRD